VAIFLVIFFQLVWVQLAFLEESVQSGFKCDCLSSKKEKNFILQELRLQLER
jgi:hypothetical protein